MTPPHELPAAIRDAVARRLALGARTSAAARSTVFAKPTDPSRVPHVDEEGAHGPRGELDARRNELKHLPLVGVPVAVKDNICTTRMPTTAASRILERLSSLPTTRPSSSASSGGRRHRRQDQLRRVRDGLVDRELGVRRHAQSRGISSGFPAARAADPRRRSPQAWCRSRSARTPADRSGSPRRCAASSA